MKNKQAKFIAEMGAFNLDVRLVNGEPDTDWVGNYDAAYGGIAEEVSFADIEEKGRAHLYVPHSD